MNISPAVEELFHQLADLDPKQRSRYFEEHSTDSDLRRQVEQLLASDEATDSPFRRVVEAQASAAFQPADTPHTGAICGPYRLIRLIGQGGMSEVWLADRVDGMVNRPVALKLPSAGLHALHFAERSHREREILANLVHPGIARLYDAGLAEDGRPFLALEYVEGIGLSIYCSARRLTVRERLTLFLQILAAVQHAHSRLVIHRDLKPSNILVTRNGEAKLLDFGIAKLLTDGEAPETELTQAGGRALTLSYASPEQIAGHSLTTASDVFSLGVILFELLSGGRPFVPKRDSPGGLEDAILNDDPRRPSQAVASEDQAEARSTTTSKLKATLKGDLDSIVLKALQKQPEHRYATVDAFRADIDRYLIGEAVLAQPESAWYRARKFVLRHKLPATSAAAVFLALAAGLSIALWQARVAQKEARTSAAVQEFTEDIFRANSLQNPDPVKARQTTARGLLDIGATKVNSKLNNAPAAKLRMLTILADLYEELALDDQAVALDKQRLTLARQVYGAHDPEIVPALISLSSAMQASRSVNEREAVLLEAKDILDKSRDQTSKTRASLLSSLAEHYASTDVKKSLVYAKGAVDVLRKHPPSSMLATALYQAGLASLGTNDDQGAVTYLNEAVSLSRRFDGDPNPTLARFYAYLAEGQSNLNQFSDAEKNLRLGMHTAKALGGDSDMDTLECESRLGSLLLTTSRSQDALRYLGAAKDACIRTRGADDPFFTPQMLVQYAMALQANGQPEKALESLTKAIENRRRNRPGTRYLGQMLEDQATIQLDLGRYQKASESLEQAAAIREKVGGKMNSNFSMPQIMLYIASGRPLEASEWIEKYFGPVPDEASVSADLLKNLDARAKLALSIQDTKAALAAALRAHTAISGSPLKPYFKARQATAALDAGRAYLTAGDPGKALPFLQEAVKTDLELYEGNGPRIAEAEANLGLCYLVLGDRVSARSLLAKAQAIIRSHKELADQYREPVIELSKRLASHS